MKNLQLKLAFLIFLIAMLGFVGWLSQISLLIKIHKLYVPIAPLTAVLLIFISVHYILLSVRQKNNINNTLLTALPIVSILIALFSIIDYFFIPNWNLEELIFLKSRL